MFDKLTYDIDTGIFTWKIKRKSVNKGDIAGYAMKDGYIMIGINGKRILAHRLAWFFVTGELPFDQIDHIDGNKGNNSFKNLRPASHSQNQHNRAMLKNNISGIKGVCFDMASGKFRAYCMINMVNKQIGSFDDKNEAEKAVKKYREENHKQFSNHGEFKKKVTA
jgi:hypothetical protein